MGISFIKKNVVGEQDVLFEGYYIFSRNLSAIDIKSKLIINTINGHSYSVAKKDDAFKTALQKSDILLPDGDSIVWGVRFLFGAKIKKIAGFDIFIYLLDLLERKKGRCFFLGSSEATLEKIEDRLKEEYPNIQVASYSPPYKSEFTQAENQQMIEKVNEFRPDVLFIGMTAPKQEKWVYKNNCHLDATVICSIGAVFDFYAGTTTRPPSWMIKLKLEWLGRLLKEPKRMWRRYLLSTPVFFIDVFKYKIGLSKKF